MTVEHPAEKDAPPTAACDTCGETIYRTGNTWPHANGLLFCGDSEVDR